MTGGYKNKVGQCLEQLELDTKPTVKDILLFKYQPKIRCSATTNY